MFYSFFTKIMHYKYSKNKLTLELTILPVNSFLLVLKAKPLIKDNNINIIGCLFYKNSIYLFLPILDS